MPGPKPDTSWRPAYLAAIENGLSSREAAAAAGVHPGTVGRHRRNDPGFDADLQQAYAKAEADLLTARAAVIRRLGLNAHGVKTTPAVQLERKAATEAYRRLTGKYGPEFDKILTGMRERTGLIRRSDRVLAAQELAREHNDVYLVFLQEERDRIGKAVDAELARLRSQPRPAGGPGLAEGSSDTRGERP